MEVQLSRFSNYFKRIVPDLSEMKPFVKYAVPFFIGSTILRGLSEEALIRPAETVIWTVSKVLYGLSLASVLAGSLKGGYELCKQIDSQDKDIKKVEIAEEDLKSMEEEILRLREQTNFDPSDLEGMEGVCSSTDMRILDSLYHVTTLDTKISSEMRKNILAFDEESTKKDHLRRLSDSNFREYARSRVVPILDKALGGNGIVLLRQIAKTYTNADEENRHVILKSLDKHFFRKMESESLGANERQYRFCLADFILREIQHANVHPVQS